MIFVLTKTLSALGPAGREFRFSTDLTGLVAEFADVAQVAGALARHRVAAAVDAATRLVALRAERTVHARKVTQHALQTCTTENDISFCDSILHVRK